MLNFGFKHIIGGTAHFPIVTYNEDFINTSNGGNQYDGIKNSSGYTDAAEDFDLITTGKTQLAYYDLITGLQIVDVIALGSYNLTGSINNIMLFDNYLTAEEIQAIEDNPGLWDINNKINSLVEWYPCSEPHGTGKIYDTLGIGFYEVSLSIIDSNKTVGIQSIGYDKDINGTIKTFTVWPLIVCNTSDDYLDTQWIPSPDNDWSIEVEQEFTSDDNYNLSGIDPISPETERFFFGEITTNRPYIRLGDATFVGVEQVNGWYKLTVVYTASTKSANLYLNDNSLGTVTPTDYINTTNTFHLGWVNVGDGSITNYKNLKIYNKKIK